MGAEWVSYRDTLPVNRAIPFWLDIPDGEEIEPCTLAWAQGSGWMWKIPTQGRYGCGYVFSDAHVTPDEAKAEIETTLGHAIEVRNDIKIDAGRLDRQWTHNCIALGLSSSFLEPLEATSIHGTVVQLMLLSSVLPNPDDRARAAFNAAAARQVDDFRDFIRLHYVTERRDTPFWQDVAGSLPDRLSDRLALWQTKVPGPEDFAPFPMSLPHTDHHLHVPVLDGLGLLNPKAAKDWLAARPDATRQGPPVRPVADPRIPHGRQQSPAPPRLPARPARTRLTRSSCTSFVLADLPDEKPKAHEEASQSLVPQRPERHRRHPAMPPERLRQIVCIRKPRRPCDLGHLHLRGRQQALHPVHPPRKDMVRRRHPDLRREPPHEMRTAKARDLRQRIDAQVSSQMRLDVGQHPRQFRRQRRTRPGSDKGRVMQDRQRLIAQHRSLRRALATASEAPDRPPPAVAAPSAPGCNTGPATASTSRASRNASRPDRMNQKYSQCPPRSSQ